MFLRSKYKYIDDIYYVESNGTRRIISYAYHKGSKIWELIVGFLFSKDGYTLQSKDGYILKAKDQ